MSALARWAAQLTDTILEAVRTEVAAVRDQHTVGTVTRVEPGKAAGGLPLIWVEWRGAEVALAQNDQYAPTVGDTVKLDRSGPQLLIAYRIVGGPVA